MFDVTSSTIGVNPNATSGVTTTEESIGPASNTANLTVFATGISKAFIPSAIQSGGTSTITITLTNSNVAQATNASFTDNLVNMSAVGGPAAGTCAGASSNTVTAGNGLKSFSGITIPGTGSGGNCTVTFNVTSSTLGTNPNSTSGVTTTQTPIAGNPSNTDNLSVVAPPTVSSITRLDVNP